MLDPCRFHHFVVDGVEVIATISPCSWMYRDYGLQLRLSIPSTGGLPTAAQEHI